MKYNELSVGSNRGPNRVGRGIAAGQGKTAGRGTKGQKARTGKKLRPGFEGGQNPLMQRLPKMPGFRSFRTKPATVYTDQLEAFGGKVVDNAVLAEAGIIPSAFGRVKLVVKGELTKKVQVKLQAASEAAIEAVQKAGGSFEQIAIAARPASTRKEGRAAEAANAKK